MLVALTVLTLFGVVGLVVFEPFGDTGSRPRPGSSIRTPHQGLIPFSPPDGSPSATGRASASAAASARASRSATRTPGPAPTGLSAYEAAVFAQVNQQRSQAGCPALTVDTRLVTAARGHSTDMANRGYFDHTTPEGVTFSQRVTQAGYRWSMAAENIASGQQTPDSVMNAWMNSSGHRANILNCGYRNIGVGLAYDGRRTPFWTQDFGTLL
jgi:uncharacterized protein YkwD